MKNWTNEILLNQQNQEPKIIFYTYCEELGKHYLEQDFKYFKSRPRIERRNMDIIESINFWSSRNNKINYSVSLEILPYVKSKSLKKWIKSNQIGRNEYIYAPTNLRPRCLDIYSHTRQDFENLVIQMNDNIISDLENFGSEIKDLERFIIDNKYSDGIVPDNFLAYVCMTNPNLIEEALANYGDRLSKERVNLIRQKVNANSKH